MSRLARAFRVFARLLSSTIRRYGRALATSCFGYDFFVSYSRADGSRYAQALHDELEGRGYYVAFDKSDLLPGDALSPSLGKHVRRSRYLLLVDTIGARASRYVAQEAEIVLSGTCRLIRISAPGQMTLRTGARPTTDAPWTHLAPGSITRLNDRIGIDDDTDVSVAGIQPRVIDEIIHSNDRRIVRQWLRTVVTGTSLVVVIAVGTWLSYRWGNNLRAAAGELTKGVEQSADDLSMIYTRAVLLARSAERAWMVRLPFILQDDLAAEVQASLKMALRTRTRSVRANIRVDSDSPIEPLVLADEGRMIFGLSKGAIEVSIVDPGSERPRFSALQLAEGFRAWAADYDDGVATVTASYDDRLERWTSRGGDWQATRCNFSGLFATTHEPVTAISTRAAVVLADSRLSLMSMATCRPLWSSAVGSRAVTAVTLLDDTPKQEIVVYAASAAAKRNEPTTGAVVVLMTRDAAAQAPAQRQFETAGQTRLWAYSAKVGLLAFGDESKVMLVDPRAPQRDRPELDPGRDARALEFSPDGKLLVVSTKDDIRVWRTEAATGIADAGASIGVGMLTSARFQGQRTLVYVAERAAQPHQPELRSLIVPEGVLLTPEPLRDTAPRRLYAQGPTIAMTGGDGAVRIFKRIADDLRDLKLVSNPPPIPGADHTSSERPLAAPPHDLDPDLRAYEPCGWRDGRTYAAAVCSAYVRVFRKSYGLRGRPFERWADLHVPSDTTPYLRPQDVVFSDDERSVTLRYLPAAARGLKRPELRESYTITYPLDFRSLSVHFEDLRRLIGS